MGILDAAEGGGVAGIVQEEEARDGGCEESDNEDLVEILEYPGGEIEALGLGKAARVAGREVPQVGFRRFRRRRRSRPVLDQHWGFDSEKGSIPLQLKSSQSEL